MGFSIAWIAVNGKPKHEILAQLALVDTGEPDEANDSPVSGSDLPGGGYLLFFNDIVDPLIDDDALLPLSAGCEILLCQVEEHVMLCGTFLYADGVETWGVTHDAQEGLYHLEVDGQPPAMLETIHADMRAVQDEEGGESADVDYLFEVPFLLALELVGYRHDQPGLTSGEPLTFTALRPA